MQDGEIAADDDAPALQVAQNVRDHGVVGRQLVVQPGIADGQAHLLQHVEEKREFLVRVGLAGQPFIEDGHAQERFAIQDRNGDVRAEQLKFLGNLAAGLRLLAGALQDAALPAQEAADARCRARGRSARGTIAPGRWRRRSAASDPPARRAASRAGGAQRPAQENDGAIDADDLAQQQQESLEQRLRDPANGSGCRKTGARPPRRENAPARARRSVRAAAASGAAAAAGAFLILLVEGALQQVIE